MSKGISSRNHIQRQIIPRYKIFFRPILNSNCLTRCQLYSLHSAVQPAREHHSESRTTHTMDIATSIRVHLTVDTYGTGGRGRLGPVTADAAAKVSELLQENHVKYHIFFNTARHHNHLVHHLLTLFSLGAPLSTIEKHYQKHAAQQRCIVLDPRLEGLSKPWHFKEFLGKQAYYDKYLLFWEIEINRRGPYTALKEYLFAGTKESDDLLSRAFSGLMHPLIHLGFGLESMQPAIIAAALAEICVNPSWYTHLSPVVPAVQYQKFRNLIEGTESKTLPEILAEARNSEVLRNAALWEDQNKFGQGLFARAPDELLKLASQWIVTPETLHEKTAEMMNAAIYFTAAAQRPPKQHSICFFLLHAATSSLLFPILNHEPWIPDAIKVKLLQWKAFTDLAIYISRGCPTLMLSEIQNYVPNQPCLTPELQWENTLERLSKFSDEGHALKLARTVGIGQMVCHEFEGKKWAMVKGKMWANIGSMIVDSAEDTKGKWVRGAGFEEAWESYKTRDEVAKERENRTNEDLDIDWD